jgi:signal transduction histidine kinase
MRHRRVSIGLRSQLALAIALITTLGVGASFLALYSVTGSRLRSQIDSQLRTQAAEWRQFATGFDVSTPGGLRLAARRFVTAQRYHAESLLIVVQMKGGQAVANNAERLVSEEARDRRRAELRGLLGAPNGLSTAGVAEAGPMRVLTVPIANAGRRVGTLRVANPLTPVAQAQESLKHSFLLVGVLTLLAAIALGIGLATLIARPLRRMARIAADIERGDLSKRAGPVTNPSEVKVLADAFDHMLDRLERTFRRQRDFVSDASHELRTPLTVVRAQVELLDRETNERRRHAGTRTLLARLDELDRLVGDMLTLASAEAGQLVEPRECDLGDFFEDLRRDLPLFGERDFRLQAIDGTLDVDPARLTQVMRNLVRNAVAHTKPGDLVTIAASAEDDRLQIAVSDSGPGIPADQLERIFERFYRLDDGRVRRQGGGLGLAIARAIVEAHGGTITAESPPGSGATFRIWLPGYESGLPEQASAGRHDPEPLGELERGVAVQIRDGRRLGATHRPGQL